MELEMRLVRVLELAKAGNLRILYFDNGDEISDLLEQVLQKEQIEYKRLKKCFCGRGEECICSEEDKERYYEELLDLVIDYDIVIAFDRPYILSDTDELKQVLSKGLRIREYSGRIAKPFEDYSFLRDVLLNNPFLIRNGKFHRMREMANMIHELFEPEREDVSVEATMFSIVLSGNYLFKKKVDEMRNLNHNFKNF